VNLVNEFPEIMIFGYRKGQVGMNDKPGSIRKHLLILIRRI